MFGFHSIFVESPIFLFPVLAKMMIDKGNCIDVPLSCMEAAACNKPVVTTSYGEMVSFKGKEGFLFVDSFDASWLNQIFATATKMDDVHTRDFVLEYDWKNAVSYFESLT